MLHFEKKRALALPSALANNRVGLPATDALRHGTPTVSPFVPPASIAARGCARSRSSGAGVGVGRARARENASRVCMAASKADVR